MIDQDNIREQPLAELDQLRERIAELEAQLARSQQAQADQRKINGSLPVLVATAGLDGYYQEVNVAFERILGWSEQESLARPIQEFVHPADRARQEASFQRLKAGESVTDFVDRHLCKDGSHRWINWSVIPVPDRDIVFGIGHDITDKQRAEEDRQQAEAALRESERRLNTLISNLSGAVYRCQADPNWTIEFLSEGFLALTGYEPSELMGRPGTLYTELIHPDDRQQELEAMQQAVAQKRHYRVEYRLRTAMGQEKWVWEQGTGVFSERGELVAIEGFTTDITARKRAEEELRQANERLEQRVRERTAELTQANERLQAEVGQRRQAEEKLTIFQRFVEAATQGFGMAGLDGKIIYSNPFLARLVRAQEPEEVIGKHVSTCYPAGYSLRREQEIIPALRSRGHWQGEQMMVFPDGQLHPTIHSIFPVYDGHGELLFTAAVITDITELKQAEEEIRQREAKYRALVESCPDAVTMVDLQGRIVFASQRAAEQHGFLQPKALVGHLASDFVVPSERDELRASIGRLVQDGIHRDIEYTFLRQDGTTFTAEVSSAIIRDAAGNPEALMAVFRDVTERKQAEEKLKREQQSLRRMVMAIDHERRLITYELHDGVAQQLLGAIMHLQSQAPRRARKSKTQDAYQEGMDALRKASTEIRRVMNRLRTPVLDRFGLVEAIEDIAAQLRAAPGAPEIEYRHAVRFQRLEPTLENSLFRIAQEALTNACRHSRSETVRVKLTQRGDDMTLEVRDWGIGFELGAVEENRFGLEGIRERTRILGGRLNIKSAPGKGTVVQVKFPVLEAADEE